MKSGRSPRQLAIAALAILGMSCSSGLSGGRSDGSAQQTGGASGGTQSTGGLSGAGGAEVADVAATASIGGGFVGDGSDGLGGEVLSDGGAGGLDSAEADSGGSATEGSGGTIGAGGATGTGGVSGMQGCPSLMGGPSASGPLPSAAQLTHQRLELTALVNLDMNTYTGAESGDVYGSVPSIFNPTNLDADTAAQWASALKAAGFRQAMLAAKDELGFCLWPSKYTSYSIKGSPWMNGTEDIVRLFADAMHAAGLRVAFSVSPWDLSHPSSRADYETYFKDQLTELLTGYGSVDEIAFDGFEAPTANVDWESVFQHVKQLQPNVVLFAGPEIVATGAVPDLQWIGTENGNADRTTSSLRLPSLPGKDVWCPNVCNVSDRRPDWSWHPGAMPMTIDALQEAYLTTVGMNGTLLIGVPPSPTGELDPQDLDLLRQFGIWYSALYKTNLVQAQPAMADSTWASSGFEAAKAVDDDICTYWAAKSGASSARLEVTPLSPIIANLISIREAIELGERVQKYHIEIKQNGTWKTTLMDKSGVSVKGTVIGQRQLWQLSSVAVEAIALVIDSAQDVPAISELGVY